MFKTQSPFVEFGAEYMEMGAQLQAPFIHF